MKFSILNPGSCPSPTKKKKRDALIKILNEKDKKIKIKDLKRRKEFKNIEFINKDDSDSLPVNTTEKYIRKGSLKLQKFWNGLSEENKGKIILLLARPGRYIEAYQKAKTMDEQDNEIVKYLKKEYDLNEEVARELILVNFENGYGNLSKKAIENILPHLREGRVYSVACKDAGYNHSEFKDAPRDKLPYYGEILREACLGAKNNPQNDMEKFGKISNVTVHIALNQVRLLINELIEKYGKPYDIAIEYARDLPASKKERDKIVKQQKENEKKNEEIRKKLEECRVEPNRYNIDKYKIWKSMHTDPLKRECPYTGKLISLEDLFSKNNIVDIDHILPLKRTFDDSFNNKVVCFSYVNCSEKGEKTPYEAWGNTKEWKKIYERAKSLNKERMWCFEKDAMERFEEQKSPIARSLNDTRYMTRILQRYLLPIVSEEGKKNIQAVPGVLTAMVREVWELNKYKDKKNANEYRSLHYHHAYDAIVIASLTRDQINRINRARKENYQKYKDCKDLIRKEVPRLNKESIEDIEKKISNIKISHKPILKNIHDENSTIGELHEETARGARGFSDKKTSTNFYCKEKGNKKNKDFTTYVPIFEKKEDRDAYFDAYKKWFIMKGKSNVKAITKEEKKIREELRKEEENTENSLREAAKKAFKWHVSGNNFCTTIYEINPKHKVRGLAAENRGEWESEVISNYNTAIRRERNENISYLSYKYPSSRKVMELHKNDMIIATFDRKKIEDMKDNDRDEDKEEKISEKEIENKSELKLCGYLKKEMAKHPGDYINILFKLKKMCATDKRMYFVPHDIAREKKDDMCWSTSCKGLKEHKAHKVFVSVTGRVLGKTS